MAICKLITMKKTLPKPTLLELDEYDMNQRVIEVLTHVCSHAILFSIVDEPKDAVKISEETQLSLSNVYKTLVNLEKLTLVTIEKFDKIEGKKIKLYRSRIKKADITIGTINSKVKLYRNIIKNNI